jgi:hypothetical protein
MSRSVNTVRHFCTACKAVLYALLFELINA